MTIGASIAILLFSACNPPASQNVPEPDQDASASGISEVFYCDMQLNGRHFFYIDPDNMDRGIAGVEFSPAYRKAHPDEVAPVTDMQSAISGSGMRFVNDRMEFHAKGDSGILTLSSGETVNCRLETTSRMPSEPDMSTAAKSLSTDWRANGYEDLPDDFVWMGGGGQSPGVTLAVPETDNFVWVSDCEGGMVRTFFPVVPDSLGLGDLTSVQVETSGGGVLTYPADVGPLPYGDGAEDGATSLVMFHAPDDPLFGHLTKGEHVYFKIGDGDKAVKLRVPLQGGISAWNAFIPACAAMGEDE